jgi:hypothetical protein
MRRSLLRACLPGVSLALLLSGGWSTLPAQMATLVPDRSRTEPSCYDSLPPSAFSRVVAYTRIEGDSLPRSASRTLLLSADALLQSVVERARAILGAPSDMLPAGEPLLGDSTHVWRALGRDLLITAYRDGHVASRVDSVGRGDAGARLLARALGEATAAGEFFVWPSDTAAKVLDSVQLRIVFSWATVDRARHPVPVSKSHGRPLLPIFSMLAPWEQPVVPRKVAQPMYPGYARDNGFRGSALLQFVVDTTGLPDVSTIRDLNARRADSLPRNNRAAYDAFVRAARTSVERSKYSPAMVGGCVVRQLVQQPFTFLLQD